MSQRFENLRFFFQMTFNRWNQVQSFNQIFLLHRNSLKIFPMSLSFSSPTRSIIQMLKLGVYLVILDLNQNGQFEFDWTDDGVSLWRYDIKFSPDFDVVRKDFWFDLSNKNHFWMDFNMTQIKRRYDQWENHQEWEFYPGITNEHYHREIWKFQDHLKQDILIFQL